MNALRTCLSLWLALGQVLPAAAQSVGVALGGGGAGVAPVAPSWTGLGTPSVGLVKTDATSSLGSVLPGAQNQTLKPLPLGNDGVTAQLPGVTPLVQTRGLTQDRSVTVGVAANHVAVQGLPSSVIAENPAVKPAGVAAKDEVPAGGLVVGAKAIPALGHAKLSISNPSKPNDPYSDFSFGMRSFDGAGIRHNMADQQGPALEPVFEPRTTKGLEPLAPAHDDPIEDQKKTPTLSFSPAMKTTLLATDEKKAIYGAMKVVRPFEGSRGYWGEYKKGVEIEVVVRGENVFGRKTTITSAATKRIGDLTREDFEGTVPAHQLQLGIRALRELLISQLEEKRKVWQPNDPPVSVRTTVRTVKFKPFIQLYREAHGPDATPETTGKVERVALKVKAEGKLKVMANFLPRAVFLDVDMLEAPLTPEQLTDMAKLQRTGVYFVALSRKPFGAPGGVQEKLIRPMSGYQLSIMMPIRFMMVTDDGAVVAELPKNGQVTPLDAAAFTEAEVDALRAAAQQAAETVGLSPKSVREVAQSPIDEAADDRGPFARKSTSRDPRVRFELVLPKNTPESAVAAWSAAFAKAAKAFQVQAQLRSTKLADGRVSVSAQKTDLYGSMDRLNAALQKSFGLYLNPGDALVLTDDPALKAANPGGLDFGGITGLKGAEQFENALGLSLGEHRVDEPGDLAGSASRMASFRRDRKRYLSEALLSQDKEEQNINFFSGHVVHSVNDWLVYELQNGRKPTEAEYESELRRRWDEGLREFKAVGLPQGEDMEGWIRESTRRGLSMYKMVTKIAARGEVIIGTEIPNFFMLKDFQRRSGELKRRYVLHTIFDFIALRPDPNKPGEATVVIYDFKTGPAQAKNKLEQDVQVLTYALFAREKWVGERFPAPYFAGAKGYKITDVRVEFIYNAVKQPTTITAWDLDKIRKKIIGTLNRIHAAEQQMLGLTEKRPAKKVPAKKATGSTRKTSGKSAKTRRPAAK